MNIILRDISEYGTHLEGELDPAPYELPVCDVLSWGPILYSLEVQKFETECLVRGLLRTRAKVSCGRCLEPLVIPVEVTSFEHAIPLAGEESIDLTPLVREDIVLGLPMVARCTLDTDGKCPHTGKIYVEKDDSFADLRREEVWGALDQFNEKD